MVMGPNWNVEWLHFINNDNKNNIKSYGIWSKLGLKEIYSFNTCPNFKK
jgi:hypothetical protein